jgi:hypothetical protein
VSGGRVASARIAEADDQDRALLAGVLAVTGIAGPGAAAPA